MSVSGAGGSFGAWHRFDQQTAQKGTGAVDHVESIKENLGDAAFGAIQGIPGVGLVSVLGFKAWDKAYLAIPGVGLLLAAKDLGDAAAHGIALLFGKGKP